MPTPNMNLLLPTPTVTVGPTYAQENNDALTLVDSHDHTSGKGTRVPTAGMNINADLTFAGFNATTLRSVRLSTQGAALSVGSDVGCLYMVGNDLWWNSGTGQQVQITIGANLANTALTTLGDTFYGGVAGAPTRLAGNITTTKKYLSQTGTGAASAAPAWAQPAFSDLSGTISASQVTAPTIQKFTATGTTTGSLFTISTSTTCAVGDTYTNSGQTFTVLAALSAQTGAVLFTTQTGSPAASGTLTRATGSGTASITYTATQALGTYTTPLNVKYIRVRIVGGGGGGGPSGTASFGAVTAGGSTYFGANLLVANGGFGAVGGNTNGAVGGSASLGTGPIGIAFTGTPGGGCGAQNTTGTQVSGGMGGVSPFGGAGTSGPAGGPGGSAVANSGSGGGGAGTSNTAGAFGGAGGGAGGFVDAIITSPAVSYPYLVGAQGLGGSAGTSGFVGGNGGTGIIVVEEYYQ
jgi:hypothetical protein